MAPSENATGKPPIINCHTHIFTADHVPPYLGKSFLPFVLPYVLTTPLVVRLGRFWFSKGPPKWKQKTMYKKLRQFYDRVKITIARYFILSTIAYIAGILLTIHVFFIIYDGFSLLAPPSSAGISSTINEIRAWLTSRYLLYPMESVWLNTLLVIALILFFPAGRNMILLIFKWIWRFLSFLPGKQTKEYFRRYLNIGRFSFYRNQKSIFKRLAAQYPKGTKFIILPMDMEFMDAGKIPHNYYRQMFHLRKVKEKNPDTAYPFLFVDPRRIKADKNFFSYKIDPASGKVVLENCFIKRYIEKHKFSGFKIYPAIGYYPFDELLLPLWRYAADNEIPILTHCIRGTIFYRGKKEKDWDFHRVFQQSLGENRYVRMFLPEVKNKDFSNNFTHPLNYLCLLDESVLIKLLERSQTPQAVKDAFGYSNGTIKYDLKKLKICFGHFGGDDEWARYFEQDRYVHSNRLIRFPEKGIEFLSTNNVPMPGKIEQLWKYTDWYSIICSIMLQYENVYSDISYIIHNEQIFPLLKQTLMKENKKLRSRVLFGTDFYVVRNHKSEKNMLADILEALTEEEFDLIARRNPLEFITSKLP